MAWVIPTGISLRGKGKLLPCTYLLAETSALAENLVFDHYRLSQKILKQIQYEVRFLRDSWPFPEEALAVLVKAHNQADAPSTQREFYYIFFPYGRPLPLGRAFLPALMLYIFTHELVHMVRFALYEASYFAGKEKRELEEKRVHAKTREILKPVAFIPGLPETLEYFEKNHQRR